MRVKLVVAGVAAVATLSGCSAMTGGSANVSAPAGATPKVSGSPSPMRVIPVTAPKARSGAPGLSTTGANWKSIVTSLTGYGQWLLGSPDPAMVGNVATPGCGLSNLLNQQVNGLINSSSYVKTAAPVITQVVGPSAATANTVALTVVASRAAEPVVSTKKASITLTTIPAYAPTTFSVTLDKGTDNKWRLCEVTSTASGDGDEDDEDATIL